MKRKITTIVLGLIVIGLGAPAIALWFRNSEVGGHWLERQIEITSHKTLIKTTKDATPSPFATDGCSGGMSIMWRDLTAQFPALKDDIGDDLPWRNCCVTHDRSYHNAAASQTANISFSARVVADQKLRNCLLDIGSANPALVNEYTILANAIYASVRLGGVPCSGLPWRWGFGLPSCYVGHQILEPKSQPPKD